jgi:iron-sulfur cluster assembly accessory protein
MIKNIIKVTNSAWTKIDFILKKSNNRYGMLFSAQSGGCNGFNYNLHTINEDIKHLNTFSYVENNKIKVYVDPMSELYLIDTTIDYINEDFSKGIFENKFKFIPDKDKASACGCGVSFSPKL